tara:strand:+ start:876 stop:1172 length:297 start_codon:yes stop_codon:yes gene_type:complete
MGLDELTLSELRELYPNIRATSKKRFLELIAESEIEVNPDVTRWKEVSERITTRITNSDFLTLCELHAKYMSHKYIKICTCSKAKIRQWIDDLNNKLK